MVLKRRHLAKSLTYRIFGSVSNAMLVWFISGDIKVGLLCGPADFVLKIVLFYVHERIWHRTKWGVDNDIQ